MIMFVIATSKVFSWYLTFAKVPTTVAEYVSQFAHSPIMILFLINILFLFVGMIMDSSAAVLILTPLLLPIVTEVGVNPIHFGVIMIVNLAIGMLTPPFGLNLFVATGLTKMSLVEVVQGTVPFIFALIALLMAITYVPALSLVLLGL